MRLMISIHMLIALKHGLENKKIITMYSPIQQAVKYINYWFRADNGKGHGIHSPFVFSFVKNILNDKTLYKEHIAIEALRKELFDDKSLISTEDYGAGSFSGEASKSIGVIAANSAKSQKYGSLLFRMAKYYQPKYILELGTSLGISTAYLASANDNSIIISGEGNPVLAAKARNNLASLNIHNAHIVTGNFDHTFPDMVQSIPCIDMAFIDGNHREEPTVKYFHELLPRMSSNAVIVFDDIHWSKGMESAWKYISQHSFVMLSIDLFFMGIVFLNNDFKVKQHFTIRF